MNGVRLVQIHPQAPRRKRASTHGDKIIVESPRGAITGTAQLWEGIREDTIFVPNSFGPAQAMGDEFGLPRYETRQHAARRPLLRQPQRPASLQVLRLPREESLSGPLPGDPDGRV